MGESEASAISRFTMPAEWEPHQACLMAWPSREDFWEGLFDDAKQDYADTANAIARFEPVIMATNPGQAHEVRNLCDSGVEVFEVPINDSWTRDSGPIITKDADGHRMGIDFTFNSWGERHKPYDKDAAMSAHVLEYLGIERLGSQMVLEGGSLTVDGEGTLITTEQCLLNPNRNPGMTRDQIEAELRDKLGVQEIIWLLWGHAEDMETDGHVDGVCTYVRPGVVIAQTCTDLDNPNFDLMAANMEVLRSAKDAAGRSLEVIELPQFPYVEFHGDEVTVSYANFYIANGGVIVPFAGHPYDEEAKALLEAAFPGREVVGVPGRVLSFGGGGPHCVTQQIPVEGNGR